MISGGQPATAMLLTRASTSRLCLAAYSSVQTSVADAPSVSGDEVPAVTGPSASKAGVNPASTSAVVSGRMQPSSLTTLPSARVIATISSLNLPAARAAGKFKDEIVAITLADGSVVSEDGCIRPETTAEVLAGLAPAFDAEGSVTAGTSSPLTDGASATLVCTEEYAAKHNFDVLARVKSIAVAGCPPEIMGYGPVPASQKALARAGVKSDQLDVTELNEAFASQAIVCIRDLHLDESKINLDGGAIALGHPLGATGARITGKAASLLKREGGKYALSTQCIGGGQGIATVLERA